MLACYYGFKCLGGFEQVNQLTRLKETYTTILARCGDDAELDEVQRIPADSYSGCGIVLTYHTDNSGALRQSTGLDILLNPHKWSHEQCAALARALTLKDLLSPLALDMYAMFASNPGGGHHDDTYDDLTRDAVMTVTHVKHKLLHAFRRLGMRETLG